MHFYPPPGPSAAERNTTLPQLSLGDETKHYLAHYFIHFDAAKSGAGFTREDALELIDAAGFDEGAEACKDFLSRAPGMLKNKNSLHTQIKSARCPIPTCKFAAPIICSIKNVKC